MLVRQTLLASITFRAGRQAYCKGIKIIMKGKGLSQQIKIKGKKKKKPFQERNASLIQAHEQLKFDFSS